MLLSVLLVIGALASCNTQEPPQIASVSVSTINITFYGGNAGGPYPGHLWYDLPNNKVNQQWRVSPKQQVSEMQIDWNNGTISGVFLIINVNPTTNHTTCGVIKLYEGPYSVNMWSWMQEDGAQFNGTTTIHNVLCDIWWAQGPMQVFHLYVKAGTNIPVRFINEGGPDTIVIDFASYQAIAPPPSVFTIPRQCDLTGASP